MRVLYLTINPNRASTTATLEGWLRLLRPAGLDPVVVTASRGDFHDWLVGQGIPAYCNSMPWPDRSRPWPFLRSLYRLRSVVRRHRCELIHCNEHDVYPFGRYLGRLCGLPTVVGVRFTMDRGFCQYAFAKATRLKRLIFVSRGSQEACREALTGLIPEARWRVVYNGTDLDHYRPDQATGRRFRELHQLGDGPLIGVAAALRPVKQFEHLFEAVSRLPASGVRLVIAGGPVPGYESYASQLLEEGRRKLNGRLSHVGHLDDVRGLLNAVDVYANTSQAEGCSNSVIQAMACGAPVISYPSTSVDEQVLPGGGAIVGQDDVPALAGELSRWMNDPALCRDARAEARRRAERLFDIREIAGQLWAEYQGLKTEGR
jgi:L-malate glycosyltransferase